MMKNTIVCLLSLMIVCSVSHADLLFKMDAPSTDLVLGGEAVTVTISAKVEGATSTLENGLFAWGLKATVDSGGIADFVSAYLDPAVWDDNDSSTFPGSPSGSVGMIAIGVNALAASSLIGVDDAYTPIATFDIQAAAGATAGQKVTYSIGGSVDDFWGLDVDGADYGESHGNISGGPDVEFTIVPEPATLVLLGLGSIVVCLRKK